MHPIQRNITELKASLPKGVQLIAVSKTKPAEDILIAYEAGQRDFGENKVQEMCDKCEVLPKDIRWHMIGHLQRNKVKYMASFVHLVHGVDSERLLAEINKRAAEAERVIDVLLQIHIASEESKFGFDEGELLELLQSGRLSNYSSVRIRGLMGMATFTDDELQIRREFRNLASLFERISKMPEVGAHWDTLSMGMSGDYGIAIEEGSTMIRVGSALFGERTYP